MTQNEAARAAEVAGRLERLMAAERDLVASGRIAELEGIVEERRRAIEELNALLPAGPVEDGDLKERVDRLAGQVRRNLALLLSLRDELSKALSRSHRLRRAVENYARS
ncbi:MAG: hypothetical protein D6718_11910 [Acidobacteria bacterium]|nr:MAG: hypothetical protein D6718_11910 [Acidobacteriota bacterium]